jgi:hypothetical protein
MDISFLKNSRNIRFIIEKHRIGFGEIEEEA